MPITAVSPRALAATTSQSIALAAGIACLLLIWLGPLPALSGDSFAAHMTQHIALVAVVAPLLAWGIAGTTFDPVRYAPAGLFAPIAASIVELVVVWAWHAPALHHAARSDAVAYALEQMTFLAAGLLLWLAALGGRNGSSRWRAAAGVIALLFTSIHMTMLGALFALAPRPLYEHAGQGWPGLAAMTDQQLGGAIMLLAGGASYLVGGLWLTGSMLRAGVVSAGMRSS